MNVPLLLLVLAALVTSIAAWSKEDYEIFDLVSAIEASEGTGTTFYSWLDVPPTATTSEITKAYRKLSMQLHPDKNPKVKGIQERFARLGVVATILRSPEGRERYDFFYKNGLPKWRGTGYYYSRFRPGLGSVLVFLTIVTSMVQYVAQGINYKRDLERINRLTREARLAAWGPKMVTLAGQRKVKVNLATGEGEARKIDMVVDGQAVYILDPSGALHPLDGSAATPAGISRTWFFSLLSALSRRAISRGKSHEAAVPQGLEELVEKEESNGGYESSGGSAPESGRSTPGAKERKGGRLAAVKAGGTRRKAIRR